MCFKKIFFLLCYSLFLSNALYSQEPAIEYSKEPIFEKVTHKSTPLGSHHHKTKEATKSIITGVSIEGISASLFFQFKLKEHWNMGTRFGLGRNPTSFILVGGERFGTNSSLNYESRDANGNESYIENAWYEVYIEYQVSSKLYLNLGYRHSSFAHKDDSYNGYDSGRFRGFYIMPYYGKKLIYFGFRVGAGSLLEAGHNELGVVVTPLIVIFKL